MKEITLYSELKKDHILLILHGISIKSSGKKTISKYVPLDEELQQKLLDAGFFGALKTEEGYVSFCVTEKRTRAEIDKLVNVIREGWL